MVHHGARDDATWAWLVSCPQCRKEPVRPGLICESCRMENAMKVEVRDIDKEREVGLSLPAGETA